MRVRWAFRPSCHDGKAGASERVEPRTEYAGRGAGAPNAAVVVGWTVTSSPAAANVATARSRHVHWPPPATCRTPCERCSAIVISAGGQVAGVGRAAELVVDHGELVARGGELEHRVDEVLAVRAEDPGGADDRVRRGRGGLHRELARELRAPVGADRAGGRVLGVRLGRVAGEDVVGGDVDDVRAGLGGRGGQVPGAVAVDPRGGGFVGLGAVDVGVGRAVDHRVGLGVAHGGADGVGVRDVEVGAREGDDVVSRGGGRDDVRAEHARGPGDEKAHGRHQ